MSPLTIDDNDLWEIRRHFDPLNELSPQALIERLVQLARRAAELDDVDRRSLSEADLKAIEDTIHKALGEYMLLRLGPYDGEAIPITVDTAPATVTVQFNAGGEGWTISTPPGDGEAPSSQDEEG